MLKWFNLGEWVTPGELPADDLVHTFYFWRCAELTAKSATALGNLTEAKHFLELANATKKAFQKRFYIEAKGSYGAAGGNIFALIMGVPENQYQKVIAALKRDIKASNGHLDTGIFGTQFFFEVLSENGMHDLAYEAMNKKEEPGYGRWLELGATTTWEKWDFDGSHNHPMFGGGLVWYYRKLAGMNSDENEPGYRHIIFKPQPVDEVSYAKYYNHTSYGETGIYWEKTENDFAMKVTVPVGCSATVYVPAGKNQMVLESGNPVVNTEYLKISNHENEYRKYKVISGRYVFNVQ